MTNGPRLSAHSSKQREKNEQIKGGIKNHSKNGNKWNEKGPIEEDKCVELIMMMKTCENYKYLK